MSPKQSLKANGMIAALSPLSLGLWANFMKQTRPSEAVFFSWPGKPAYAKLPLTKRVSRASYILARMG